MRKWRAAPFPRSSRARLDWAVHYLSLPWKLLFACIPPTLFFGGKATFVVALVCIGAVTAIIGDVAALFGCVLGMPDAITAITVALGTSLPDTFLGLRAGGGAGRRSFPTRALIVGRRAPLSKTCPPSVVFECVFVS